MQAIPIYVDIDWMVKYFCRLYAAAVAVLSRRADIPNTSGGV